MSNSSFLGTNGRQAQGEKKAVSGSSFVRLDSQLPDLIEPKRVLFFGKKKSRTCCTGALVQALRSKGIKVRWVNCALLRRWLGSKGLQWTVRRIRNIYKPDLCFVFFHDLPLMLMEEFSCEIPTVVWMEEQPKHTDSADIDYVRNARLLCLSTPNLVSAYRDCGIKNSTFLMSGFSERYHCPSPRVFGQGSKRRVFDRDVCFIGGPGSMGYRPDFLARLSRHTDLEIFGRRDSWLPYKRRYPQMKISSEVRPRGYAEVCASSRIVLGINQNNDSPLYFSNRLFLTLACKGFHLTHYVPRMEELFEDGVHLAWFHDQDDCLEKIAHYLGNEDERLAIADAGFELAMARHRYEDRVDEILSILRLEIDIYGTIDEVVAAHVAGKTPKPRASTVTLEPDPIRKTGSGRTAGLASGLRKAGG